MTRRRALGWVAWWLVLFVSWLLLVDTFATAEVIAGIGVAAIAAFAAEAVHGAAIVSLRPWGLVPAQWWRLPAKILTDCWLLAQVLWREVRDPRPYVGEFRGIPFDAGGEDARSGARRALFTATISLTPNTYVIGIDREEGNMLIHELAAGPRETTVERVLGKL